jgi:pSer/pThr/pTyr-binding forkhead associated (FHA) protein
MSAFILRDSSGREYPISKVTRIGRDASNEIILAHERVSRHHATVWEKDGTLYLRDENSSNGTSVNGSPIQHTALQANDQITIGDTTFVVIITGAQQIPGQTVRSAPPARADQVPGAQPKPKRRSCLRSCSIAFLATFLVLAVCGLLVGAIFLDIPQKLGLKESAAERLLSDSPDRVAAAALRDELDQTGIDTQGMEIYVLPFKDRDGSLAYALLDAGEGFQFTSGLQDPIADTLISMAASQAVQEHDIQRIAIDYRNETGERLLVLTASTSAINGYANGMLSREEFMQALDGEANLVAFYQEFIQ